MAGPWDAEISLLYAVEAGRAAPVRLLANGAAFDVVSVVGIGENLMQVVDDCELFVFVRNRSRSTTVLTKRECHPVQPQRTALTNKLHIGVDEGWTAHEGDVLDVSATLKVTAGINTVYSCAEGPRFIVV